MQNTADPSSTSPTAAVSDFKGRAVQSRHVQQKVHGSGAIGGFNTWIAVHLTRAVGTMWCAYVFALLALVALPSAVAGGTFTLIQWLSQTFIQLVMLSVIMVGQNVLQAASDERALADHETLRQLYELNQRQMQVLQEIRELREKVDK